MVRCFTQSLFDPLHSDLRSCVRKWSRGVQQRTPELLPMSHTTWPRQTRASNEVAQKACGLHASIASHHAATVSSRPRASFLASNGKQARRRFRCSTSLAGSVYPTTMGDSYTAKAGGLGSIIDSIMFQVRLLQRVMPTWIQQTFSLSPLPPPLHCSRDMSLLVMFCCRHHLVVGRERARESCRHRPTTSELSSHRLLRTLKKEPVTHVHSTISRQDVNKI
jgi:hypothetical protein